MTLKFQAIDWRFTYQEQEQDDNDEYGKNSNPIKNLVIQIFGKTETGENVYVEVINYSPCFYVNNIPNCRYILNKLSNLLYNKKGIKISEPIKRKNFYGFSGDDEQEYIKISSTDYELLKRFINYCSDNFKYRSQMKTIKDICSQYDKTKNKLILFESNKDVIIQYLHEQNLKPCGWIEIDEDDYDEISKNDINTNAHYNIRTEWTDVKYLEGYENTMAKFTLGAYDIESISSDDGFPIADRASDKIVSIATTFSRIGEPCYKKIIAILGNCPDIDGVTVINCKTEAELLIKWCQAIQKEDPDMLTSWNGFGFDDDYIKSRAELLGITRKIKLSRTLDEITPFIEKMLSSAAYGDNKLRYYDMRGRVNFDLMKLIQREHKLGSYKLDSVAVHFFREQIKVIEHDEDNNTIITTNTKPFSKGQYTSIVRDDGVTDYECCDNKKFHIIDIIDETHFKIAGIVDKNILNDKGKIFCCQVKDDVNYKEIFSKYKSGEPEKLKELSLYNIQDCELCNKLCEKLCVIVNNSGMSNVCSIPINWIFNRGQSPKAYSLVSKLCKSKGYLIPAIKKKLRDSEGNEIIDDVKETFEGACVIEPKVGLHPCIFCLDYAALYPRSIICRNISHETYVTDLSLMDKYKNDYTFTKIDYTPLDVEANISKRYQKSGNIDKITDYTNELIESSQSGKIKTCYFAKSKNPETIGLIPEILKSLLDNRANVRKQQKLEKDGFKWKVLEGLQLAYKVTCNSIYGQLGCAANIGPIACMDLAACTTATGRLMLQTARTFAEVILPKIIHYAIHNKSNFIDYMNSIYNPKETSEFQKEYVKTGIFVPKIFNDKKSKIEFYNEIYKLFRALLTNYKYNFEVTYGDTDSIMVNMNLTDKQGNYIYGHTLREINIKVGELASKIICTMLPYPEQLEYEKILSPFLIISKKRYVGNLYEHDPEKYFQKNMGIVLKRRDNAQIVKYVVGGVVDRLLNIENHIDSQRETLEFAKTALYEMIDNKFNINMFVVTKTLKRDYKNKKQIAHAVLADRIALRDPGNKPAPSDRIPYAYVQVDESKVKLQGDRIETPEYIKKHNLKLDYAYYIIHQIQEPCMQFLELFDSKAEQIFKDAIIYASANSRGYKIDNIMDYIK